MQSGDRIYAKAALVPGICGPRLLTQQSAYYRGLLDNSLAAIRELKWLV